MVPVWIANLNRAMPKGELIPVPILCTVTFGMPVRLREGEEKTAFLERARAALLSLRPREHAARMTPARQTIFLFLAIGCVLIAATAVGMVLSRRAGRPRSDGSEPEPAHQGLVG